VLRPGEITSGSVEKNIWPAYTNFYYAFFFQNDWKLTPTLTINLASYFATGNIAYGHHEKLDGRGYPRKVTADHIPVQTRLMTIADIFDALTASDRPYKRALPVDKALDILRSEAKDGMLDAELVELLIETGVYRRVLHQDWREL
jgi:hypothetical protein